MTDWNPDKDLIDFWEAEVKRNPDKFDQRIGRGSEILTWFDIIEEMREGVPNGRRMYEVLEEMLKENSDIQKRFDDWKAKRDN